MLTIRRAEERGGADHGWLSTRHSFSFADYYDPAHMGFRALRVINEDFVEAGTGFGTHPHRDMEILTYVLSGAVAHRDSMGTASTVRPGEVQRMTAGTGVRHSELNPSREEQLHLLQIWIEPERRGLTPGYEQRAFPAAERQGRLRLLASRDGADDSLVVHQDVRLYGALLAPGETVEHALAADRHAWLQVARGEVTLGAHTLHAGDGVAVSGEGLPAIRGVKDAEILLFDLG